MAFTEEFKNWMIKASVMCNVYHPEEVEQIAKKWHEHRLAEQDKVDDAVLVTPTAERVTKAAEEDPPDAIEETNLRIDRLSEWVKEIEAKGNDTVDRCVNHATAIGNIEDSIVFHEKRLDALEEASRKARAAFSYFDREPKA